MITPKILAELVMKAITGDTDYTLEIMQVYDNPQSYNHAILSFSLELKDWTKIDQSTELYKNSKNILQWYFYNTTKIDGGFKHVCNETILQSLSMHVTDLYRKTYVNDREVPYDLVQFKITNNKVELDLTPHAIKQPIKIVILYNSKYGKNVTKDTGSDKTLHIECIQRPNDYAKGKLSFWRLERMTIVFQKVLSFLGYSIASKEQSLNHYIFIANECPYETKYGIKYKKCLYEHVFYENNSYFHSNVDLFKYYFQVKYENVMNLYKQKYHDIFINKNNIDDEIKTIVEATITYELLSVEILEPIILNSNINDPSVEVASYILFVNSKIIKILDQFTEQLLRDEIPPILSLDEINVYIDQKYNETRALVHYFMIFPDIIANSCELSISSDTFKFQPCNIWKYAYNLCLAWDKYNQKNHSLRSVKNKKMDLSTLSMHIHLARATRIILSTVLNLLEVKEIEVN